MSISAEAIIRAAVQRGELDDLLYKGERIPLDDDRGIHPEDRLSYKVLRNAGMVPPEVAQKDAVLRLKMERNARR